MSKDRMKGRPLSRRSFLKVGLAVLGSAAAGVLIGEPRTISAQEGAIARRQRAPEVPKVDAKSSECNVSQSARNIRIQKFIAESEALVRRYGHADYDPTKETDNR